jgi:YD repeat-containing protein
MKKKLQIIILLLSVNIALFAQEPEINRPTLLFPIQPKFPQSPARLDSFHYQFFSGSSWDLSSLVIKYTYDNKCREATVTEGAIRRTHTYNANNQRVTTITENRVNNAWVTTLTTNYEYDQGRLIKLTDNSRVIKYKYNAKGKMIEIGTYNAAQALTDTVSIAYNSVDSMVSYLRRWYNANSRMFQLKDSSVYTYNAANLLTKSETKIQSGLNDPYTVSVRNFSLTANTVTIVEGTKTITLDYTLVSGRVATVIQTEVTTGTSPIYIAYKTDYTYNSNGIVTSFVTYDRPSANGTWSENAKSTYTLAANGLIKEVLEQSSDDKGGWDNYARYFMYANTCTATPVSEITHLPTTIYPNPTTDLLQVKLENAGESEVRIMNTQGQIVRRSVENGTDFNLNVANLNSGIYWLLISQGNKKTTKSFVKSN